jgi:hypothetical protein
VKCTTKSGEVQAIKWRWVGISLGGACSTHERNAKCLQNFPGEPEGKRPLGRYRLRWEDNIRMGLTEIRWEVLDWIELA